MLRQILSGSRYLVMIAVIALFLASMSVLIYGGITILYLIYEMFSSWQFSTNEVKHLALGFIEELDFFLLGTVLYIMALGLYELFIDKELSVPSWLVIANLDDLEVRLLGIVIVLLAVAFLGEIVSWDGSTNILALGIAVGLVLLALGYIIRRSSKAHLPAGATTQNHEEEKG